MNWDALGAIGEVAGAIATIIMLIYLSIQIRQHSSSTQAATELEATKQLSNIHKRIADDPELQRIWDLVVTNDASIKPAEIAQFIWHMAVAMQLCQGVLEQHQRGLLSQVTWNQWERVMAGVLKLPVVYTWWSSKDFPLSPEFYDYFEKVLAKDGDWAPKPPSQRMDLHDDPV